MEMLTPSEDLSTKYTIFKLKDPDHISKLIKYLTQYRANTKKTSYCRFYLRGLCIMKSQHCKFAHDFSQLDLQSEDYVKISIMDWTLGEKEARKKLFLQKTDFHQRPLFFIKNLDYLWLYNFQFTERYKKSGIPISSVTQINKNESLRTRIREIMHRQQWDKFISYIQFICPNVDYTISMFSTWFGKIGFEKAQTFCKFGDFMRYLCHVRGYHQVNIIVPPLTTRSVYFIKAGTTVMAQRLKQIKQDSEQHKNQVRRIKQLRQKKLPQDLWKRFICRFYMAGNCQKTSQQCLYVHKIADHRYDPSIQFLPEYRQPPKSKEDRLNYISLYQYYLKHRSTHQQQITLEDINSKFGLKDKIRKKVHLELYGDFLRKIQKILNSNILKLYDVKKEYFRFGFNHTDENKFGQLENCFWELGFHQQDIIEQNREKRQYIYRIPPLEEMDKHFKTKIMAILNEQINEDNKGEQKSQILQSSLRRLIYSKTNKHEFQIPLHAYLRKKQASFKAILEQHFPQYCKYIFFQSSQENFKKLIELLKKYFKKQKKFIYKMETIDGYIRGLTKEELNMNNFVNFKNLVELALLQLGKQIYFWPLNNASLVVDRVHSKKTLIPFKKDEKNFQIPQEYNKLWGQWAVVVDNFQTFQFCKLILSQCNVMGVDLEGRLCEGGYIDFIQISCSTLAKKHIFIIDIYLIRKNNLQLYLLIEKYLKIVFESDKTLKIMHACQQDSIALNYCMGIKIINVFDTSGMQIYYEQRKYYKEMHQYNYTFEHTLQKIHCTKTPGLNQILQKWNAPKGPNQYKQAMKKIFSEAPRSYYTTRPIVQQFLMYSARDVEDLIEVWQNMKKEDNDEIWQIVGEIYNPLN